MSLTSLCLCVALSANPTGGELYHFSPALEASIRGQSPSGTFAPSSPTAPAGPSNFGPTLGTPMPVAPNVYDPFNSTPGSLGTPDPWSSTPEPLFGSPGSGGPGGPIFTGVNGPQLFRYGYIPRIDIGYLAQSAVTDTVTDIEMFEFDSELRHHTPLADGWIFGSTPEFNYRAWNTGGTAGFNFLNLGRANLYRFGWEFQLAKPVGNGWSLQFTFNPSINTDFEHQLTSDAYNFDGSVMAFYQVDPVWTWVIGAGYWDRVDDIVIPMAGVIITPDDRWEFRLTFPKARIAYFLGNFWAGSHWLYASVEYNVEAYQIDIPFSSPRNRVQYEDWRLALGMRSDHGWFDKYIEVAWVTGRNFEFQDDLPKFDVDDTVMVRGGIRF